MKLRDAVLLTLPIVLIAGVAFWRSQGGKGRLPFFLEPPGPFRLKLAEVQSVELKPSKIAEGMGIEVSFVAEPQGELVSPPGWSSKMPFKYLAPEFRLVYKRGGAWKASKQGFHFADGKVKTIGFSLKKLPKDVEEVRLRGKMKIGFNFPVTMPLAFQPKNPEVKFKGNMAWLESNELDFPVKLPGQTLIIPEASHRTPIEVRGFGHHQIDFDEGKGKVFTNFYFLVHLRHLEKPNWSEKPTPAFRNVYAFDGNNKPISIHWDSGRGDETTGYGTGGIDLGQNRFNPKKPKSDIVFAVLDLGVRPKKPWESYPQPIRLTFDVSDGECWPAKVKATFDLRKPDTKFENLGLPQGELK